LNILFAGTPEFSCPTLQLLIDQQPPVAVLTQPDRPAGRGRKLTASAVKQLAVEHGLRVLTPTSLRDDSILNQLAALKPDLLVTAAYGLLLPDSVLGLPRFGCWNLHASLLPRWRGASPIQQAILAGDDETGISLMQMDAGLDTGDVLLTRRTGIAPDETAGELQQRLALLAADTLAQGLGALQANQLPAPQKQADELATHAPKIQKQDARIDWRHPATRIARQIRAFNPWPVAFAELEGETVRMFSASALAEQPQGLNPGQVVPAPNNQRLLVACGEGMLDIHDLQSPGRRRMTSQQWLHARAQRNR